MAGNRELGVKCPLDRKPFPDRTRSTGLRCGRDIWSIDPTCDFSIFVIGFVDFFTLPLVSGGASAADAVVTEVDRRVTEGDVRFALKLDRALSFRLFTLADPYRVVLDLPEVGWRLPARPLPGQQGIFRGLRYGLFRPGNSRVVLDFNEPVGITDAFLATRQGGGYQIVVTASRTTRDRFLAAISLPPREVTGVRPAQTRVAKSSTPSGKALAPPKPAVGDAGRLASVKRRTQAMVSGKKSIRHPDGAQTSAGRNRPGPVFAHATQAAW